MSLFGEIGEPSSRADFEDWDGPPSDKPKLQWKTNSFVRPKIVDAVLIFEGEYLFHCIFAQTKNNLKLKNTVEEIGLSLYKIILTNNYVFVVRDYDMPRTGEVVELIRYFLNESKEVLTLQTRPLTEYQSPNPVCQSVIRTVSTTNVKSNDLLYPALEQPNMLTGISAGVISLREHLGLAGKTIVCYVSNPRRCLENDVQIMLEKLAIGPPSSPSSIDMDTNLYT
ncbi:uncharacterized protein LOC114364164 [Ostrinia furnacalis]|uniref:uncharacterized protein LOC114364164 n=1 Tax=Ostrinia furnacalis TaxID=93504 RepID=UPI00103A924D|nr:uncharacterized protein LOC114364164 [Ostrinia furnacalis]XP_028175985.1 uncharacterized protein LOC114364164 [Ostrinia furnacalis]XP_028175986.1 uncharacterized protein LOC114364164 [Ostrinia furnacalis]XP_028175987.1 uncharacterized protein LOC114364164 [Ostrinia furnacalis]XP_028175988.1 uncharacterized protein LOC114364164 [Ostrinia furnacalis]XP_028175989.1 uncharacterized protein LOC114364164 [Ostrinia furnacalis]